MQSVYSVEPELCGTLPRPLRKRAGATNSGIGCIRVFILPFIAVGIGTFLWALLSTLVGAFGQVVPGQITGRNISSDSDGTTYYLLYSYNINGQSYDSKAQSSFHEYNTVQNGTPVQVRALAMLPNRGAQLLLPGSNSLKPLFFPWFFTLFWNFVVSWFVWFAWVSPIRNKRLLRYGAPTVGRICEKKLSTSDDSTHYFLEYEYAPVEYGTNGPKVDVFGSGSMSSTSGAFASQPLQEPLKGKTLVTETEGKQVKVGDPVTVLFDQKQPKKSVLYRFATDEVAS